MMFNPATATLAETLLFIGRTQFREFTESDWDGFAGCDSSNPMIAAHDEWTVILDGSSVSFSKYNDDFSVEAYECKLIRE
jgi:hypothetical protein